MDTTRTRTAIVTTVDLGDVPPGVAEGAIRDALARLGAKVVPTPWAPDQDLISECTGAGSVYVVDP